MLRPPREKYTDYKGDTCSIFKIERKPLGFIRSKGTAVVNDTTVLAFKQSMGDRNRVGIGLAYRPARQHMPAELILWNRFLGSLKV